MTFIWAQFQPVIAKISLKITCLRSHSNNMEVSGLIHGSLKHFGCWLIITPHAHHYACDRWQLDCLFNSLQANINKIAFCDNIPPASVGLNCGICSHVMTSSYNDNVFIGSLIVGAEETIGYYKQLWQVIAGEKHVLLQTVNLMHKLRSFKFNFSIWYS